MSYEVITVDWNPEQTRIWRHHVEKMCPGAKIHTIPDMKPIPGCWSCGKIPCFSWPFKTKRVIYLDTDVIVTHDLADMFDLMGDTKIGVSFSITPPSLRMELRRRQQMAALSEHVNYKYSPIHANSGVIVLKDIEPMDVYEGWLCMHEYEQFLKHFKPSTTWEEYSFSLWMAHAFEKDEIWDMPQEIHGNLCGGKHFGTAETPWVIHYHKEGRARKAGLGDYLDV